MALVKRITVIDGPVGTELARRGVPTPLPLWSAHAIEGAPEALARIHADYAAAGATVHTANTFRTDPWTLERLGLGDRWQRLTGRAVAIARDAVPEGHRVAGSIAPLEDCYRPDLAPDDATCRREHARFARALAAAGADLLLCETFPGAGEALAAASAALSTGLPVWLSMTQGPGADLISEDALVETLSEAAARGVEAVLVNCNPVDSVPALLERLAGIGVPFGAYGNVGRPCSQQGWRHDPDDQPGPYGAAVRDWLEAGATIVGGCCGTTPAHIAAVVAEVERFAGRG
jgi:S-methylmethionine-dependent homocysteine/selenocysteine methylase